MRKRLHLFVVGLIFSTVVLLAPTHGQAQTVPRWDFSVAGFVGAGIPLSTDVDFTNDSLVPAVIQRPGTVKLTLFDIDPKTSLSYGGKLTAWTTVFRAATGMDFGAEIDVTHFTPDLETQTLSGQASVNAPGVLVGTASFRVDLPSINPASKQMVHAA